MRYQGHCGKAQKCFWPKALGLVMRGHSCGRLQLGTQWVQWDKVLCAFVWPALGSWRAGKHGPSTAKAFVQFTTGKAAVKQVTVISIAKQKCKGAGSFNLDQKGSGRSPLRKWCLTWSVRSVVKIWNHLVLLEAQALVLISLLKVVIEMGLSRKHWTLTQRQLLSFTVSWGRPRKVQGDSEGVLWALTHLPCCRGLKLLSMVELDGFSNKQKKQSAKAELLCHGWVLLLTPQQNSTEFWGNCKQQMLLWLTGLGAEKSTVERLRVVRAFVLLLSMVQGRPCKTERQTDTHTLGSSQPTAMITALVHVWG